MVGAVVGVQPFGGEGLSGTGPKAGGPLYLLRLLSQRPADALARTFADADRATPPRLRPATASCPPCRPCSRWGAKPGQRGTGQHLPARFAQETQSGTSRTLPGPTGERNVYTLAPRAHVLCVATSVSDLLVQTAAVLASGGKALRPTAQASLRNQLPAAAQAQVVLQDNALTDAPAWRWTAALHHGDGQALQAVCTALAQRPAPSWW